MREIKFRVLVRRSKEHEWKWRDFFFPEELQDEFYLTFEANWKSFTQYTGLKDKSGKEIYEGDVINNPRGENVAIEWGDGDSEYGSWNGYYIDGDGFGGSIEVIGNIYENPELLK